MQFCNRTNACCISRGGAAASKFDPMYSGPPVDKSAQLWLSAHLHFSSLTIYGADADEVITRVVVPLTRAVRERYGAVRFFFIRYADNGPHIRIRFREPRAKLSSEARSVITTLIQTCSPTVRIVWVDYDAEVGRYGGPHALDIAERVFEASSIAAFAFLDSKLTLRSRLGRALLAMLATVHVFLPTSASAGAFAARYSESFQPSLVAWRGSASGDLREVFRAGLAPQETRLLTSIREAWDELATNDSVLEPIGAYVASLQKACNDLRRCFNAGQIVISGRPARAWNDCVNWLLPSYVHMMNNRLGVSIAHEAYLAFIVQTGLSDMENDGIQNSR